MTSTRASGCAWWRAAPEPETDTASARWRRPGSGAGEPGRGCRRSRPPTETGVPRPSRSRRRRRRPKVRSWCREPPAQDTADPVDYSVAADGSIRVVAAKRSVTMPTGSALSAARLRALNHLHGRKPVVMGRRLQARVRSASHRAVRAAPSRLPRAPAGRLFCVAPHRRHRDLYRAPGDSLWSITQKSLQGAGLAVAAVQPGPGFRRSAPRHADFAAESGGCLRRCEPCTLAVDNRRCL